MQLLYFGWVRAKIGISQEEIDLPDGVSDVRSLIDWLQHRGSTHSDVLEDLSVIRVAVNQEMAEMDTIIAANDEVALFPPMTGG